MQKQKHPSGQNQGYRYNGNNGTEGGGAGGGYPGTMRICPQGPGQPGTQQQDPKQQAPQQAITSGMPVGYSQTARTQNQYFQRHQRLSTPRLAGVGNMPMPNISYAVQGGQSVYPVVSPIMMPQIPYQLSQAGGARHQTHAPAPTAAAGPASGSFFTQPPPQGTIYIPQHVPPTAAAFYGQPPIFGLPTMRNSTYPANSAPNQMPTQQAPPQQPQVVSGAGGANQGMMPLGMQPGAGPPPQILAGAQQGAQLGGQPGPLVGQPGGAGPPLIGSMPLHKDKRKRPKALIVTNPDTGIDVIAEMFMNEEAGGDRSGGSAGQSRDNDQPSQVVAEFAARVAAVATDSIVLHHVAPTVTETPPPQPAPVPSPAVSAIPSEDVPNTIIILSNGPQAPPSSTPTPPPMAPTASIVEQHVLPPPQPVNIPQPPTQAIPIVSAQTNSPAVDLHRPTQHVVSVPSASSPARKPIQQQSAQHTQQLLQENAELKQGKSKKDGRRPTPIPTPPPAVVNQQHSTISTSAISGNVVQLSSSVPSAVQHLQQQPSTQIQQQTNLAPPLQKEHQINASTAKRDQILLPPVQPPTQPHKSAFADSIDVKNFITQQQAQIQQSKVTSTSNSVTSSCSLPVEQKETNGETDVHETTSTASAAHSLSSNTSSLGPNSVGSKAQQRQKQSKQLKKKDLNRKGVEKEGTDMDAFVGHVSLPPNSASPTAVSVAAAAATVSCTTYSAGIAATTVIQETIIPAASTTASSTVPTSVTSSQQRQPSPTLEKRLPIVPPSSPKQAQDERDSSETISTTPTTSSSIASPVETAITTTSISSSVQSTPAATPMSEDSDSNSIEAMVAAKNQENTKVSALLNNNNINNNNNNNTSSNITTTDNNNAKTGDDDDVQVSTTSSPQSGAGTVIETMTIERSQPQLLYNYKEGQWSPLNTDGKKVYDREFLLEVRKNPLSTKKPNNHIDPDVFREKPHDAISNSSNNRRNVHASNSMSLGNRGENAVPAFMRSSQSQRGGGFSNTLPYSMPSSKGGRGPGGGGGGPRMGGGGSMGGSMRDRDRMMKGCGSFGGMNPFRGEEPILHKSVNSWKPSRNQDNADKSDEEMKTEKLLKSVRGILNKLTPQKFETLWNQVLALPIDTNDRLTRVVHLVFAKAVDEPSFSKEYAELCRRLSVSKGSKEQQQQQQQQPQQQEQQHSAFRKVLLTKCQEEFEKNKNENLNIEARTREIEECTDSEKKKELKLQLEEEERKVRIKKVGLVRFIGELYKLKMLTNKIMHNCINILIDQIEEESLECLCKLLTTIGKQLEQMSDKKEFDVYFHKMMKLTQKTPEPVVSLRIRFMLQDVIELRMKNWVPRRDENNPKTIEQIEKDAERESMLESALLAAQGSGNRSGGGSGRHDSRDDRRGGRQRGGGQTEDGWHSVSGKNFTRNNYSVEPSKLQTFKEIDGSMSLGSSNQWGQWTMGAGTKKSSNPQVQVNNKFAALGKQDQDERKPIISSMMNRKGITPSPSLEKDRAFAAVKEVMLDGGRSNVSSSGGTESGPPSRENSRLRSSGGSLSGTNVSANSVGLQLPASVTSQSSIAPQPTVSKNAPLMSEDEAERKTKTLIEEWLENHNIQESVQTVQDTFDGVANIALFLRSALNYVLDHRKVIARPRTGHLVAVLVQDNILPVKELIKELATIVEFGDDFQVDIPHVWKYIGELLGPLFTQEVISFADLRTIADQVRPNKGISTALAEVMRILIKEKGPGWIRTQWESSRVQMKDFVPEQDMDKFIKENNLGFIMGEEVQGVADASLTPVMVEEKILSFLQKDNDKVLDHISDWINANVGEKIKENDYIKSLTRAVIKATIKEDKFSSSKLLKYEKLIKKFVDNDEGRELACVYAIQNILITELIQAPGILLETFQIFYENGTISRDAFLRWKEPKEGEILCDVEHSGRGVALATLQSFFVSLSEQDDSDDETTS